jgi:IS1 family transposase
MDEKWSFVGQKQERCDAAGVAADDDDGLATDDHDDERGDRWDHVAIDAEHRLVLAVVPGRRTAANCRRLVSEVHRRTGGRTLRLITTDEHTQYKVAIHAVYGRRVVPLTVLPRPPGRPRVPKRVLPAGVNYAVVHKYRDADGRVVRIGHEVVFGTTASVAATLARSTASRSVNTSFLERHNGTDRHRNARKARCTYRFSKRVGPHDSMTYFTAYSYNFCCPVRTLATRGVEGRRIRRTPAMAAGLADHVWSVREWVTMPAVQST